VNHRIVIYQSLSSPFQSSPDPPAVVGQVVVFAANIQDAGQVQLIIQQDCFNHEAENFAILNIPWQFTDLVCPQGFWEVVSTQVLLELEEEQPSLNDVGVGMIIPTNWSLLPTYLDCLQNIMLLWGLMERLSLSVNKWTLFTLCGSGRRLSVSNCLLYTFPLSTSIRITIADRRLTRSPLLIWIGHSC
jgi:hypothetical protein